MKVVQLLEARAIVNQRIERRKKRDRIRICDGGPASGGCARGRLKRKAFGRGESPDSWQPHDLHFQELPLRNESFHELLPGERPVTRNPCRVG